MKKEIYPGLLLALGFFTFLGYLIYFMQSFTEAERSPSSIPQRALQITFLAQPALPKKISQIDMNKLTPKDVTANEAPEKVIAKIADRGINEFFASPQFRSSKMGHITEEVKETVKADVAVQQHRFSARLEPLQKQACFSYTGILKAELKFNPSDRLMDLELKESLSTSSEIYYLSSQTQQELASQIGFRFSF